MLSSVPVPPAFYAACHSLVLTGHILKACQGVGILRAAAECSLNPYADFAYDGLHLNPMEVVFVKVKRFQQEANWGSARLAASI